MRRACLQLLLCLCGVTSPTLAAAGGLPPPSAFSGQRAYDYAQQIVNCGPRWIGSTGHVCAENYLKKQFAKDRLEEDTFTASTPMGPMTMHNFIVKFPGKKNGVIVLASHYETNYPLRNIHYVGANDGAATSGALIEMGNLLRGRALNGESVWLVFFDGEEAIEQWSETDSLYGSRHLAARWDRDGTLPRIRAFLLLDMIGDKDLNVDPGSKKRRRRPDAARMSAATALSMRRHFADSCCRWRPAGSVGLQRSAGL